VANKGKTGATKLITKYIHENDRIILPTEIFLKHNQEIITFITNSRSSSPYY